MATTRTACEPRTTFVATFEAMLDEAVRITTDDLARPPDLRAALESAWALRDPFFAKMVDAGIATGEVAAADRDVVLDTVITIVTGLIMMSNGLPVTQTREVEGLKRLLAGALIAS